MTEILAPAGDEKSALAAINSGADAIYLGLTAFSARSSAENFDFDALEKIVRHAHAFGVKIYVAMNTLVKEDELSSFVQSAVDAWNVGADAIILQDMALGSYLKKNAPQMVLHLSTQAGVNNVYGARLAKRYGFDRVILARETKLDDIAQIAQIIETEVFVQGALCTCFSGQCYLSSFAGGNSGNRGKCKQPCRKKYSIDRTGFEALAYRLSLSDLCVGENIGRLTAVGVSSFKIEGRMRRPEYVAAAVNYYKNILGGKCGEEDFSALKRTYNRGNYTKGLAFGQDKSFISSAVQGHIGEFCGVVKVVNGRYLCLTRKKCAEGDCFKLLRDGKEVCGATYGGDSQEGFFLNTRERLKNGDKVFITTDVRLNRRLTGANRTLTVALTARLAAGERVRVQLNGREFYSDFTVSLAESAPLTAEDVRKCFSKTDRYPFTVHFHSVEVDDGVFAPLSALNRFRREVYESFYRGLGNGGGARIEGEMPLPSVSRGTVKNRKTAVIAPDLHHLTADVGILKPSDYLTDFSALLGGFAGEKYLYLPPFFSGAEIEAVKPRLCGFDGIYCDGWYGLLLAEETGKKFFAGTGLNLANSVALSEVRAQYVALSKELTKKECVGLCAENTFNLTAGDIKVMDLVYCPFEKTCKNCDKRRNYLLKDENGRAFPLIRYKASDCRFELYNCAPLVGENDFTGILADCTLQRGSEELLALLPQPEKLKAAFKNYTKGHTEQPVK